MFSKLLFHYFFLSMLILSTYSVKGILISSSSKTFSKVLIKSIGSKCLTSNSELTYSYILLLYDARTANKPSFLVPYAKTSNFSTSYLLNNFIVSKGPGKP